MRAIVRCGCLSVRREQGVPMDWRSPDWNAIAAIGQAAGAVFAAVAAILAFFAVRATGTAAKGQSRALVIRGPAVSGPG
jgi:hypothetical protein